MPVDAFPLVSRLLAGLGHEVLVANAYQLRLIYASPRKSDRVDAETLARSGRLDPALLKPIRHRGVQAQVDLAQLRAHDCLVRARAGSCKRGLGGSRLHIRPVLRARPIGGRFAE